MPEEYEPLSNVDLLTLLSKICGDIVEVCPSGKSSFLALCIARDKERAVIISCLNQQAYLISAYDIQAVLKSNY